MKKLLIILTLVVSFVNAGIAQNKQLNELTNQSFKSELNSKVRSSLLKLEKEYVEANKQGRSRSEFASTETTMMIENGMVRIQATAKKDANNLISALKQLGATHIEKYGRVVNAWFPIENIPQLSKIKDLILVKPVYMVKGDIGAATSEGDLGLQAIAARQNYCVNGAGVRVGILSDSYTTRFPGGAAAGVASGDLPGVGNPNGFLTPVTVVQDGAANNIDEGRAMAEIVHDLAPGAQLFFSTANGGEAAFANAILNLASVSNCNVIVDDIRYFEEPFYMDGPIALACNTVFNNGVAYFASAGNYGTLSYESAYRSSGGALLAHDFDPGADIDTLQTITVNSGSTINLTLQWDDPWGSLTPNSAATNLDVFLINAGGTIVAQSTDNNVGGDPTEFFSYTAPGGVGTLTFRILITRAAGPAPSVLKWVIRNSSGLVINEYPPTTVNARGTGYGHSNATGANAVAAAFWGQTPAYGVNPPQPEGFTSNGGVQIRYNTDGVPITPVTRNKPEFCAVDGTLNTFFGNGNQFFGTSAAAPHAAAVAALMLEANASLTPTQVRNLLVASSIDMLTPGFDFTTGSGLIQADVAVREAIELTCNITGISVQSGPTCIAGQSTYNVTLRISYTSPPACNDILWVNGQEFPATGAIFEDVTLTGLNPNGLSVSVTAYFKSAPGCSGSATNLFTAPQKPTITCPAAQVLVLGPTCSALIPNYIPLATVNSSAPGTVVTQVPAAGTEVFGVGAINVTITVTDDCGSSNCNFTVNKVDNTPPTIVCPAAVLVKCAADVPAENINDVTASDNCGSVTVTWEGDVISNQTCFNRFIVTRTYKATDASGNTATCQQIITVNDDEGPAITNVSVSHPMLWPANHKMRDIVLNYTVADNCGGPTTTVVTVSSNEDVNSTGDGNTEPDWVIIDNRNIRLRAERAGNGDGRVYTITITSTDECDNSTSETTEVRVAHNITGPISGRAFKIGSTVNFAGTFWDVPGSKHTARWVIDGSTTTSGRVTAEPAGSKNGTATGSYKFNSAGVYKLRMEVTDQLGRVTYADANGPLDAIVVIYDPNGGYTYGGGSFQSPGGAFPANPQATGQVSYGFQNNYFKSATNPKGETQLSFMVGDFEYNALNYEYLAVDKHKAQFRGSGRITGAQSGISFIMTVIDGDVSGGGGTDKVRMKVFNKNTGQVYYDNQPGAGDADDPTMAVTTGSTIVIGGTESDGGGGGGKGKPKAAETTDTKLKLIVANNPSTGGTSFRIQVLSDDRSTPVNLRLVDVTGRALEAYQQVAPGSTIETGHNLTKGMYFAEAVQGSRRIVVKLLKN